VRDCKVEVLNVASPWELWDSGSNPSRDTERLETLSWVLIVMYSMGSACSSNRSKHPCRDLVRCLVVPAHAWSGQSPFIGIHEQALECNRPLNPQYSMSEAYLFTSLDVARAVVRSGSVSKSALSQALTALYV
jgi:hypothetical protein